MALDKSLQCTVDSLTTYEAASGQIESMGKSKSGEPDNIPPAINRLLAGIIDCRMCKPFLANMYQGGIPKK